MTSPCDAVKVWAFDQSLVDSISFTYMVHTSKPKLPQIELLSYA